MKRWIPAVLVSSCVVVLAAAAGCSGSEAPSTGGTSDGGSSSGTSGASSSGTSSSGTSGASSSGTSGASSSGTSGASSSGTSGASSSGTSGDAGHDSGTGLPGLSPCTGDAQCASNVCFIGGNGGFCSLHCTAANAATVCVAPFSGVCNKQGFCK